MLIENERGSFCLHSRFNRGKVFKIYLKACRHPLLEILLLFLHFHLKEHSVDCAKKGDENKNTEYCRLHSESLFGKLQIKVSRWVYIPVWVMRVRVSEVIPGWVHKRVHGVSLSPGRAFTSDRRQRVGKGGATTKRIINLTNKWSWFASLSNDKLCWCM